MRKRRLFRGTLMLMLLCGCLVTCLAQPPHAVRAPAPLPPPAGPPVVMKFREMRFAKPPLVYLYFDMTIRNSRDEPRWFLLPSDLGIIAAPIGTKGGVDGLEAFAPRGAGRAVVGHFLGTGGFRALRLPAHARVRLRLFPISFWGDLPDELRVEIVTAKRLRVGDEDAASWFKVDPTTSARADITGRADDAALVVGSRSAPGHREVAVLIDEDSRSTLQVSLANKNKARRRETKSHTRAKGTREEPRRLSHMKSPLTREVAPSVYASRPCPPCDLRLFDIWCAGR